MTEEDFDQEEFAQDVNNDIEEYRGTSHLFNFHHYGGESYKVYNETYENVYEDSIYVDINYNTAIDDETLILTIEFDSNNPFLSSDSYTVNDYNPSEVADALIDMMKDLLDNIYKHDKNLLKHFIKEDLEYLAKKYPDDIYIKSMMTGSKYQLFDYNNFINEYLTPEEEESGEVDDFHNLSGEFKDIGEETDESYNFYQAIQEDLEDFYGKLELKSSSESDLKIHLHNYANDSKFVIELEAKGIGTEDIYFHIDFDTENEDYRTLEDTSIDSNPKDVADKLRYLILKRYNEYYIDDKSIVSNLPKELINKLATVNPNDDFFRSWKGVEKFQMFDYNQFNESKKNS